MEDRPPSLCLLQILHSLLAPFYELGSIPAAGCVVAPFADRIDTETAVVLLTTDLHTLRLAPIPILIGRRADDHAVVEGRLWRDMLLRRLSQFAADVTDDL